METDPFFTNKETSVYYFCENLKKEYFSSLNVKKVLDSEFL